LGVRAFEGYHPQARIGALVSTDDRAAAIYNGAIDFCEGHCAPRVAMVTTERREWDARPGMIWAAHAPAGRSGRSKVQV
jgi:hypothetical protein